MRGSGFHPALSQAQAWEYETEWIWCMGPGDDGPTRIDASLIDSVVLGALMPEGLRDRVLEIVAERETPTAVHQARMDPDDVRLRLDDA